jgi:hypothetical protein
MEDALMKKIMVLALAVVLALTLAACGGRDKSGALGDVLDGMLDDSNAPNAGTTAPDGDGEVDLEAVAADMVEDAVERNAFSEAAAEEFWKIVAGVDKNAVTPDWDWIINEERMGTYGDTPDPGGYGHGVILFEKKDGGEISEEEYKAWAEKVFKATAAASDDGHNIIGWEFVGDGEDALSEVSLERALDGWLQGWGFMRDGRNMVVYLGDAYDTEKDSAIGRDLYYYGVSADIAIGLQKSMDEAWDDMEAAFEEHGDEIKDALEDYAN